MWQISRVCFVPNYLLPCKQPFHNKYDPFHLGRETYRHLYSIDTYQLFNNCNSENCDVLVMFIGGNLKFRNSCTVFVLFIKTLGKRQTKSKPTIS